MNRAKKKGTTWLIALAGLLVLAQSLAAQPSPTLLVSMTGEGAQHRLGHSVASAGDVNGDGYPDVIVGAYGYNVRTGRAYLYHGGPAMDATPELTIALLFERALRAYGTMDAPYRGGHPLPSNEVGSPASGRLRPGETLDEALRLAQEVLVITQRSGYVLQGADVCLFLAVMALEEGDREAARRHAEEARRLATCDGPPPVGHTYKVAYDEAGALQEQLAASL